MQNGYLPGWIEEASAIPAKVQLLFEDLTEAQLNTRPGPDRWSIGELVDHIIISNELHFPILERIASGSYKNPFLGRFTRIHTFLGHSLLRAVEPDTKKKYRTVRQFQPVKGLYSLKKLDEFLDHQERLIDYARATDHEDHQQVVIPFPVFPVIVYSLETAFKIILSHELRHINQAMDLKKSKEKQSEV